METPPPGRSLMGYSEEELKKWYQKNYPSRTPEDHEPDLRIWQEGLMADDDAFTEVSKICAIAARDGGLLDFVGVEHPDQEGLKSAIEKTTLDVIHEIESVFPAVPKDWLYAWISSWAKISIHEYIESPVLQDFGNYRTATKSRIIEYHSRGTEGDRLPTPAKGWSPKSIPLYRSTMILEIAGNENPDVPYTLGTSSCVFAGRLGESPQDLIFELFIDEFQYVLEERGRPIDLRRGVFKLKPFYGPIDALGIASSNSSTIKSQPGFVNAIEEYWSQKPEPDGRIEFIFIPDNLDLGSPRQQIATAVPVDSKGKQKSAPAPAPASGNTTETRGRPTRIKEQTYEEKIPRLRNMFRPKKLPTDEALRQALRNSNGNIAESFALLSEQMKQENLKKPNKVQGKPASTRLDPQQAAASSNPVPAPLRTSTQASSKIPTATRRRLPNDTATQRPNTAKALPQQPPTAPGPQSSTVVSTQPSDAPASRDNSQPSSFRRVLTKQKAAGSDLSINKGKSPAPGGAAESLKDRRISIVGPLKRIFGGKQKEDVSSPNSTVGGAYDNAFPEVKRLIYRSGGPDSEDSEAVLGKFKPAVPEAVDDREVDDKQDGVAQFKELLNREFLTQLDPGVVINDRRADWESCCEMFGIDPTQNTPHDKVQVAGLREPLYRFQAFGVFWQMIQSRNAGGGIVGDSPGLGKTLTYLALLVVERQLSILWNQVELSRLNGDTLHLPEKGQYIGAVCPSPPGPGWICCPCVNAGPTSKLPSMPGVRMALVPASLVGNWRKQWKEHIDSENAQLGMQLLITGNLDDVPQSELADLATNITQLRAYKSRRGNDHAMNGQERFLVIATAQTYDPWIAKFRYGGPGTMVETPQSNGKSDRLVWRTGGHKYQIQIGIACADECHEDHHVEQGRVRILARLPGNPACWGYSGTPFDHSPRCLEGILYTIEQQAIRFDPLDSVTRWSKMIYYNQFTHEKFDDVCSAFANLVKAKKLNQERLDILLEALIPYLTTFMIRRTQDTRWFGHELVELKPSIHRDIILTHNEAWDSQIEALRPSIQAEGEMRLRALQKDWEKLPRDQRRNYPTSLGFRNMAYSQNKLRILATCPSFVQFTTGPEALSLKNDETRKWYGKAERISPYRKNIREIFQNSPKLIWLRQFLIGLDGSTDVNGEEQKVIILTNFYCVALTIKIMIERYIRGKNGRVGMIYAEQPLPLKSAAIESFIEDRTEDKKGNEIRKHKHNYQYMVGTPKQLGTGHNLTRSCNVILMEPDVEFGIETQCYSRVKRAGQKNPVTFTYRLLDSGSEIESQILDEHKKHGGTHGTLIQEESSDVKSANGPRRGFSRVENELFIRWALGKHYEGFKKDIRPDHKNAPTQQEVDALIESIAGPSSPRRMNAHRDLHHDYSGERAGPS